MVTTTAAFPSLTPSRVSSLVCRKQFHELHVLRNGPPKGFSPACAYGTLMHETLKAAFDPTVGIAPGARDITALARRAGAQLHYPDSFRRDADLARCIESAVAYIQNERDDARTLGVEVFGSLVLRRGSEPSITLGCKFDRLLVRLEEPDHLVLRDYKTGASGAKDLSAACIMLAIARRRYEQYSEFSVEFDYLNGSGLVRRDTVTLVEAQAVWPDLKERALRVYGASEFPAEPGEYCCWCPLRKECQPDITVDLEDADNLFV